MNRYSTTICGKSDFPKPSARVRPAFTLIELLVVMALTAILMTLIFRPLIEATNLTSRAGTQIETQTNARNLISVVEKTLSDAVFVYDSSTTPVNLWVTRRDGAPTVKTPQYTMLEYVRASRVLDSDPQSDTDPTTGDPLYAPGDGARAGFALPLAPGRALGRLFIGLANNSAVPDTHPLTGNEVRATGMPLAPYVNKFEEPRLSQDNRYLLYRAEVSVYVKDPDNVNRYIPNLSLFHTGATLANRTDSKDDAVILHDPNFFYDSGDAGAAGAKGDRKWAVPGWRDLNLDGKVQIWENWKALSSALVPVAKADVVALDRDENSYEPLYYDNAGARSTANDATPRLRPLVTFAPGSIQNEPASPGAIESVGVESPLNAGIVFNTQYANWARPYSISVFRNPAVFTDPAQNGGLDPATDPLRVTPNLTYYQLVVPTNPTANEAPYHIVKLTLPPGGTPPDEVALQNQGRTNDVGPNPDPQTGFWRNQNPEFAFSVNTKSGLINFGFPHSVTVNNGQIPLACRYSPYDINDQMRGANGYVGRYLDLKTLPAQSIFGEPINTPGIRSPLDLMATLPGQVARVQIVPGSERVFGPDQNPGPNYGYRVEYSRVAVADPSEIGKNQYRINYADAPNALGANVLGAISPENRIGFIEFAHSPEPILNALPAPPALNEVREDPAGQYGKVVYRPYGIPTLRVAGGVNLPVAPVEVTYNFQMNRGNDVVTASYLTREMMNVSIEMRLYDPRSSRPQITSLSSRVKVRNLQK